MQKIVLTRLHLAAARNPRRCLHHPYILFYALWTEDEDKDENIYMRTAQDIRRMCEAW